MTNRRSYRSALVLVFLLALTAVPGHAATPKRSLSATDWLDWLVGFWPSDGARLFSIDRAAVPAGVSRDPDGGLTFVGLPEGVSRDPNGLSAETPAENGVDGPQADGDT